MGFELLAHFVIDSWSAKNNCRNISANLAHPSMRNKRQCFNFGNGEKYPELEFLTQFFRFDFTLLTTFE